MLRRNRFRATEHALDLENYVEINLLANCSSMKCWEFFSNVIFYTWYIGLRTREIYLCTGISRHERFSFSVHNSYFKLPYSNIFLFPIFIYFFFDFSHFIQLKFIWPFRNTFETFSHLNYYTNLNIISWIRSKVRNEKGRNIINWLLLTEYQFRFQL